MTISAPIRESGRIGYVLSYPLSNINKFDNKITIQLNKLIAKLSHKYPKYFTSNIYTDYFITTAFIYDNNLSTKKCCLISNEENLKRLKNELENFEIVICFGEKADFAVRKVKDIYNLNYKIIKTKSIVYPVSRHIKTLYSKNNNHKHFRTNFNILMQFKDIDKQMNNYISSNK